MTYQDYTLSYNSSKPELFSNDGIFTRDYVDSEFSMTVNLMSGSSIIQTYTYECVETKGYVDLTDTFASGYIYTNYSKLSDTFFDTLDVSYCAFACIDSDGSLDDLATISDLENINKYVLPAAHAKGKWVVLSIADENGNTDSEDDFAIVAANATLRKTFIENVINLINTYNLDGVDIDWETPKYEARGNFTLLMKELYTAVKANNQYHIVTAAVGGGATYPKCYDLENSLQYIDYINLMTYNMATSYGYFHNALYKSTTYQPFSVYNNYYNKTEGSDNNGLKYTLANCSVAESVSHLNTTFSVPYNKIVIGLSFYGVEQVSSTKEIDGMNRTSYYYTKAVSYGKIKELIATGNYNEFYSEECEVPYLISKDGTTFYSYENPKGISAKCKYAIDNNFAGIMFWQSGQDYNDELVNAINISFNSN